MKTSLDKKISNLLIKQNIITSEKDKEIDNQSINSNISYVDTILKNNIIPEATLLSMLALDANIPPIDIDKIRPDDDLVLSFDIIMLDEAKMFLNCDIRLTLSTASKIKQKLDVVYNPGEKDMEKLLDDSLADDVEITKIDTGDDMNVAELTKSGEDAPIIKFVNKIIYKALEEKASDIHIEPYEKIVSVRYRRDGVLHEAMSPPKKIFNAMLSRIKIMTSLDIAERRIPQDGKFQIKFEGRQIDFRVSTLPTVTRPMECYW